MVTERTAGDGVGNMGYDYYDDELDGQADMRDLAAGRAGSRQNRQQEAGYSAGGREDYGRRSASAGRRQASGSGADGKSGAFRNKVAKMRAEEERKKKRRRRLIAMAVAECVVLVAIFSYAHANRLWNLMPKPNVDKENVENPNISLESINKMQGYWMVAIFGVDSGTGTSSARGNSSDVNMIACVNQDTGEVKLVSVYRDTYLKVSDKGTYRKFNYAYSDGGPEQALKMLNENLDLNITEYIIFNWKAVADGINILGGVDMEITDPEFKFINAFITETVQETGVGSYQLKSAGMNHLDGIQAVAYGRLRLMDSDYQRVERQKKVIEAAFAKAKQADYSVLNNILVVCLQEVMTNLDFADLTNVALNISKYHIGDTAGFPFERSEANMGKARGACIIPQTLESNVIQLHQFLFGDEDYTPTEAVRNISQKISSDSGVYAVQNKQTEAAEETQEKKETGGGSGSKAGGDAESGKGDNTGSGTKESKKNDSDSTDVTEENREPTVSVPKIGETDADGNLVDGPEPDDWYSDDGSYIGGESYPGTGETDSASGGLPGDASLSPQTGGSAGPVPGDLQGNPDGSGFNDGNGIPGGYTNPEAEGTPGGYADPGEGNMPGGYADPGEGMPGGGDLYGGPAGPGSTQGSPVPEGEGNVPMGYGDSGDNAGGGTGTGPGSSGGTGTGPGSSGGTAAGPGSSGGTASGPAGGPISGPGSGNPG